MVINILWHIGLSHTLAGQPSEFQERIEGAAFRHTHRLLAVRNWLRTGKGLRDMDGVLTIAYTS